MYYGCVDSDDLVGVVDCFDGFFWYGEVFVVYYVVVDGVDGDWMKGVDFDV